MQKLLVEFKSTSGILLKSPPYKWSIKQRGNSQQLGNNNSEEDQHSGKSGRQDLQVPVINIQNQLIPDNAICVIG
ncbi:hypothetical protein IPdc08_01566 [archaeon]|nr:hypothetical protein IPdc08_01566 [archaeon]